MLRVNKKMEYGILALLFLGSKPEQVASVREMAEACHVPEALLSKIMQAMKNAELVKAVHGNQGGYRLGRQLAEISLLDIIHVLDRPVQVAECLEPGNDSCRVKDHCTLVSPMQQLNKKIIGLFQGTSLETLSSKKVAL